MDGAKIPELENKFARPTPFRYTNVGIAINGKKKNKCIVTWALENLVPEGNVIVKLIHVHPKILAVPTPLGNSIPISQVRDNVAAAYLKEMEWRTSEMLLPYKRMCALRKVEVDIVIVESDDVANAIAAVVAECAVKRLVIGVPSHGFFIRKHKGLFSKISACIPNFCSVYAISEGKLSSILQCHSKAIGSSKDDKSDAHSVMSKSNCASSTQADITQVALRSNFSSPYQSMQHFHRLMTINQNLLKKGKNPFDGHHSRLQSMDLDEGKAEKSRVSGTRSMVSDNHSCVSDRASTSDATTDCPSSESRENFDFELERLRIELRRYKAMITMTQSQTNDASQNLKDLKKCLLDKAKKLEEITTEEEKVKEIAREEIEKCEASRREARRVRLYAERQATLKRQAETEKALHDDTEKEKLKSALEGPVQQCQIFTWEEIVSATSSFSEDLNIGVGSCGTLYKGNFHHTTAAVKVLHPSRSCKTKQFQQELGILSKIHHPHLLLLIGACPDHSCLVYEYMENGSLEDRLMQKNETPPIPWFERFKIAWEVASALAFLHNTKPKPIIHRDLKPASILLDHNLVSKISDVGLATMLQLDSSSISTTSINTGPVGTLCYIDPEYQRTDLICQKSDVYSFGMVILQLLTAKPAIALAHLVEDAVAEGNLINILDRDAGNWPVEETKKFAELGLSCIELRRRDRPDLQHEVLPLLLKLKEVADKARDSVSHIRFPPPPHHFICPILKDVMNDPCVATDGYTYDRKAIEIWLEVNDTSPMTNLPLPSKLLIPNYTLLSAIMEWKSTVVRKHH